MEHSLTDIHLPVGKKKDIVVCTRVVGTLVVEIHSKRRKQ